MEGSVKNAEAFAKVLGRTFRLYRNVRNIPLSKMAKGIGFAFPSGWSRIETGETVMTVAQLYAAAKFLKVEPHDVVKTAMEMMSDKETE